MKRLLALALVLSVPAAATPTDDIVYEMTGDRAETCQPERFKPESRGFKIARKQDTQTIALQRVRAQLISRNPKDKLIPVIDKAINAPVTQR